MAQSIWKCALDGDLGVMKQLLQENSKLICASDENRRFPLHWACSGGHEAVVNYLVNEMGSEWDSPDDSGWTPLMIASSAGHTNIVDLLIKKGVGINHCNNAGHTSLQYAASRNRPEIVELLLKNGADPSIKDDRGATALHRASSRGNFKCVDYLLVKLGHKESDLDVQDSDGNTPLHLACEDNCGDVAKLLVERGANMHILNKEERTPISLASKGLAVALQRLKKSN